MDKINRNGKNGQNRQKWIEWKKLTTNLQQTKNSQAYGEWLKKIKIQLLKIQTCMHMIE